MRNRIAQHPLGLQREGCGDTVRATGNDGWLGSMRDEDAANGWQGTLRGATSSVDSERRARASSRSTPAATRTTPFSVYAHRSSYASIAQVRGRKPLIPAPAGFRPPGGAGNPPMGGGACPPHFLATCAMVPPAVSRRRHRAVYMGPPLSTFALSPDLSGKGRGVGHTSHWTSSGGVHSDADGSVAQVEATRRGPTPRQSPGGSVRDDGDDGGGGGGGFGSARGRRRLRADAEALEGMLGSQHVSPASTRDANSSALVMANALFTLQQVRSHCTALSVGGTLSQCH